MNKTSMIRRTAALLALLLTLPLTGIFADNGGAGVRSYYLTERYGIDDVRHVFFFSRERLCALSVREMETVEQYDLVFIDLEQAEALGSYSFERERKEPELLPVDENYFDRLDIVSRAAVDGETLRFVFPNEDSDADDPVWDTLTIGTDGVPDWQTVTDEELWTYTLPGGTRIVEWDASLFAIKPEERRMEMLIRGSAIEPMESWDYRVYRFFAALDDHRFVYRRKGWEYDAGFGLYDLNTRTDRLIDEYGAPEAIHGNTLYTNKEIIDLTTWERKPLPDAICGNTGSYDIYCFAPDGSTMCMDIGSYTAELEFYEVRTGNRLGVVLGLAGWGLPRYVDADTVGVYSSDEELREVWVHFIDVKALGDTPYVIGEYAGVWYGDNVVGAGYADRYRFAKDGTFVYLRSDYPTGERESGIAGTYTIKDHTLTLTITAKIVYEGGEIAQDTNGYWDSPYLDGGEDVLHMLAPDQYETRVLPITDVAVDPEFLDYTLGNTAQKRNCSRYGRIGT